MIISITIITLLIMRGYIFSKIFFDSIKKDELERNVASAFKIYSEVPDLFLNRDSCSLDIYGDSSAIVTLKKVKWGCYDLIEASSKWNRSNVSHIGLFGADMDRGEDLALYLTDSGINLSLSGKSLLKGTCYVPEGKIKSASVEGHPFAFKKITEGNVKSSNKILPEIDPEVPLTIQSLFNDISYTFTLSGIKSNNIHTIDNSFYNKTIKYYDKVSVTLSGMNLKGNLIIKSSGTITLDNSINLENVIIMARNIIIKDGFSGSFQGFALESINVEKGTYLKYPSVLGLIQDQDSKLTGSNQSVIVNGNSIISGAIIVITDDNRGFVSISPTAVIYGQVYCNGSVELDGELFGSLYCNLFSFSASRTNYINHLLNAIINFSKLPSCFSGIEINNQNSKKSLIRWVN